MSDGRRYKKVNRDDRQTRKRKLFSFWKLFFLLLFLIGCFFTVHFGLNWLSKHIYLEFWDESGKTSLVAIFSLVIVAVGGGFGWFVKLLCDYGKQLEEKKEEEEKRRLGSKMTKLSRLIPVLGIFWLFLLVNTAAIATVRPQDESFRPPKTGKGSETAKEEVTEIQPFPHDWERDPLCVLSVKERGLGIDENCVPVIKEILIADYLCLRERGPYPDEKLNTGEYAYYTNIANEKENLFAYLEENDVLPYPETLDRPRALEEGIECRKDAEEDKETSINKKITGSDYLRLAELYMEAEEKLEAYENAVTYFVGAHRLAFVERESKWEKDNILGEICKVCDGLRLLPETREEIQIAPYFAQAYREAADELKTGS